MGHVPTSVVVVAGVDRGGVPHGITIGSFVSISLDPTLVGFFIGDRSRTWPLIADSGCFSVSVLAADQAELCWKFAAEEAHDFGGVAWSAAPSGAPRIAGAVAWIDCEIDATFPVGDHLLVVGRVTVVEASAEAGAPMVFHRGSVAGVSATPEDR